MPNRRQALSTIATALSALAAGNSLSLGEEPAPASASKVTKLLQKDLPADANEEVTVVTVDYAPGGASQAHRHPGPVVGYVLEGEVEIEVDAPEGTPLKTFRAGEIFFEPQGAMHKVSRNASKTKPARILAFVVGKKGAPLVSPAK
ncbi:quercetin dioxygenase-like cupin family protein [Chthoniobacter flavus]|uniref:cupin domain-containing protein n=1 Tax=Chthoniobacter flavus TaxID=191863 RepID=UPI001048F799|nr:cupin domain-containing protein [Chthoniobacter flavus]TCO90100.1 quercetin dioxygenase-like cupin family protein [Chthoniobacter flavus]